MRRFTLIFTTLVVIFSCAAVYSAPVGNIASPELLKKGLIFTDEKEQFGIVAGPEIDLISNHKIKDQVQRTKYNFYGAKAGLLILNRAIVYGLLGAADANQEFDITGNRLKFKTNTDLSWGVGATVVFFENKAELSGYEYTVKLGADGRFRRSNLGVDKLTFNGAEYSIPAPEVTGQKFEFDEWQAAAEVSVQIYRFIPYFGVKYSDVGGEARATVNGTEYKEEFSQKGNVGVFAGGDILVTDSVSIYAEGRFIDEVAFSAGGLIRF